MDIDTKFWRGKRVLVTGHTGFKGSWLVLWLHELGAQVFGLSLAIPALKRSLFIQAEIANLVSSEYYVDIRDETGVDNAINEIQPDYVFHLAGQALVRRSMRDPRESITTNISGTANVLLSSLSLASVQGITIATSDKVYQNIGDHKPFRETDRLGGKDPYSSSKAAAELVVDSLATVCNPHKIPVTTARAGNVIGGGDWGEDRLVPDLVTALDSDQVLLIRSISATRPWQYVLDCLQGYLLIAQSHLSKNLDVPKSVNIGPSKSLTVQELINIFEAKFDKKVKYKVIESNSIESNKLELDSQLAFDLFGWKPTISPKNAIKKTSMWYFNFLNGYNPRELMDSEIIDYMSSQKNTF